MTTVTQQSGTNRKIGTVAVGTGARGLRKKFENPAGKAYLAGMSGSQQDYSRRHCPKYNGQIESWQETRESGSLSGPSSRHGLPDRFLTGSNRAWSADFDQLVLSNSRFGQRLQVFVKDRVVETLLRQ